MRIVGITGGVDTHGDRHMAAAMDQNGGLLGVESFPGTEAGYEHLFGWLAGHGEIVRIGVEGTGSWVVGLTTFLTGQVVEVGRPNRQTRRRVGKSDPSDAVSAARAALSGTASVIPKSRNDSVGR